MSICSTPVDTRKPKPTSAPTATARKWARRRLTPKEATANARTWKEAFPDARGTITSKIVEGNKGVAEIIWRGTNRGSLMGNPPTGKSIEVRAVVVIETEGGAITRSTHYIDVAGMMAQLGVGGSAKA